MDREKLRQELGQQLQAFGFKKAKSLDSRVDLYVLCGSPILGRPNHRTEVGVDYYGWKITYYPKAFGHYAMAKRWIEHENPSAEDIFNEFFDRYGL